MSRTTVGLHELPTTPHFLYRFYDRTDTLLYIGITNDPKTRFKWHRKNQPWWPDVDERKTRVAFYPTREAVLDAERKAIVAENPLYNDQHNLTVDTPTSIAIEEAKANFADSIMRRLLSGEDAYNALLREAAEEIRAADEDADYSVYSSNPKIYGAAMAAERITGERWNYREAFSLLLETLPISLVEQCRANAEADLADEDRPPTEDDIAFGMADFLAEALADEYLDGLDQEEAQGWRACGAAMLHPNASRRHRVQHAAAYAKATKAGRGYEQAWQLCIANGSHRARCAGLVELLVFFAGCPLCGNGQCLGHPFWCSEHLERARGGSFSWSKDDEPVVISRTSPWGPILEEPPF